MSAGGFPGCSACDHGWRYVGEEYLADRWPITPGMTEAQIEAAYAKREAYREQVYPCPDCRPDAFRRWANGCFRGEHRATKCDLCRETMGEKAATSHDRALSAPGGRRPGGDL